MQLQLELVDDKQHQAHSSPSDVDMKTREQSAAIKKTVVETATRELVLEHACELVETFPISKEKALILSVIRLWDSLDSITKKKVNDRIKATFEVDLDLLGEASEIDSKLHFVYASIDRIAVIEDKTCGLLFQVEDELQGIWKLQIAREAAFGCVATEECEVKLNMNWIPF